MKIQSLFIDKNLPVNDEIDFLLSHIKAAPQWVEHSKTVYDYINRHDDPVSAAKQSLYITKNKGAIIRKCPGTRHYTCCDYTILHTGTFCNMDCAYCILQAYFHPPVLQYFAGLQELGEELEQIFNKKQIFRIGTGEFTDSLIWETISPMPKFLVQSFAGQNNSVLELKTKTVQIESLLSLDHKRKTILSWSLNTEKIINTLEKGTASLSARLKAAQKAEAYGYRLAFHFDPIIIYPDCEKAYQEVIKQIFQYVSPESIVWISLGTFRFMPQLKQIIETRFPDATICYGEFILGLDNKMRYFKPLRINIYKKMIAAFREYAPDVLIYFCMEDEEVWEKCMGFFPKKQGALGRMLDESAALKCELDRNCSSI